MAFRHGDLHWRPWRRFSRLEPKGGRRREETLSQEPSIPRLLTQGGYSSQERLRSSKHSKLFVPVVGTTRVVSSENEEARGRNQGKDARQHINFGSTTPPQSANHRLPARDNSARDCKDYSSLPGHSAGLFFVLRGFFQPIPTPTPPRGWDSDGTGKEGGLFGAPLGAEVGNRRVREGLCFPPSPSPWLLLNDEGRQLHTS
jgi:hypothetical protein